MRHADGRGDSRSSACQLSDRAGALAKDSGTHRAKCRPGLADRTPPSVRRPKRLPVAEAWLTALTTPDGRFDGDDDELDVLAESLAPYPYSWRRVRIRRWMLRRK